MPPSSQRKGPYVDEKDMAVIDRIKKVKKGNFKKTKKQDGLGILFVKEDTEWD